MLSNHRAKKFDEEFVAITLRNELILEESYEIFCGYQRDAEFGMVYHEYEDLYLQYKLFYQVILNPISSEQFTRDIKLEKRFFDEYPVYSKKVKEAEKSISVIFNSMISCMRFLSIALFSDKLFKSGNVYSISSEHGQFVLSDKEYMALSEEQCCRLIEQARQFIMQLRLLSTQKNFFTALQHITAEPSIKKHLLAFHEYSKDSADKITEMRDKQEELLKQQDPLEGKSITHWKRIVNILEDLHKLKKQPYVSHEEGEGHDINTKVINVATKIYAGIATFSCVNNTEKHSTVYKDISDYYNNCFYKKPTSNSIESQLDTNHETKCEIEPKKRQSVKEKSVLHKSMNCLENFISGTNKRSSLASEKESATFSQNSSLQHNRLSLFSNGLRNNTDKKTTSNDRYSNIFRKNK